MEQKQNVPPVLGLTEALAVMDEEKSEMDKVLEIFLNNANIGHLTELNRNEILSFSALGTIAQKRPQLDTLKVFLAHNLIYRVSKGRAGRKELVKLTSRQLQFAENQMSDGLQQPRRNWFGRRK